MTRETIRLAVPEIGEEEVEAVACVLTTGMLVQGDTVRRFEDAVAGYVGVKHAIAVSSGTAALHVALLSIGIKPGDRVAVSAYSWPATANVIELCGAVPVFVDIAADSFNMSPNALERVLDEHSDTRAVLVVHAFGLMADMTAINALASGRGIPVIEDAACALGARHDGTHAGAYGICGCFSFHPRKNVTTGEGGMITTNDLGIARLARAFRNHGQDPEAQSPEFILPGFNYRLTEFQAALGVTQMPKLDAIIAARRKLAARYTDALSDTPIQPPVGTDRDEHVVQSYVVQLPGTAKLADIIATLQEENIECGIGTYHLPITRFYREKYGYRQGDFAVTDNVYRAALTLPLSLRMSPAEQDFVIAKLRTCIGSQ